MSRPRNGSGSHGAEGGDMRTPRRHRLTRRQSEQMLDGLGDPGDLAQLLADARPLRATDELSGETAALAAFRSAAVTDLDPRPRSNSVRTLSLSRALAVKVLAVAAASTALGGAAFAATGGHLPGTGKPAPVASGTTLRAGAAGDRTSHVNPPGHPSGTPTDLAEHREDLHAIGLCRAYAQVTGPRPSKTPLPAQVRRAAGTAAEKARPARTPAVTRAMALQELITKAGGSEKVTAYCESLARAWCERHHVAGPQPLHIDGRDMVLRCVRPIGRPSLPTGLPTTPPSLRPTTMPSAVPTGHGQPGRNGRPTGLPTGAPVRN